MPLFSAFSTGNLAVNTIMHQLQYTDQFMYMDGKGHNKRVQPSGFECKNMICNSSGDLHILQQCKNIDIVNLRDLKSIVVHYLNKYKTNRRSYYIKAIPKLIYPCFCASLFWLFWLMLYAENNKYMNSLELMTYIILTKETTVLW